MDKNDQKRQNPLIKKEGGTNGQFRTPRHIIKKCESKKENII